MQMYTENSSPPKEINKKIKQFVNGCKLTPMLLIFVNNCAYSHPKHGFCIFEIK
jgi:hypothetical protein